MNFAMSEKLQDNEGSEKNAGRITRRDFFKIPVAVGLGIFSFGGLALLMSKVLSDTDKSQATEKEWEQIQPPLEDVIRNAMTQRVNLEAQLAETADNDLKEILKKLMRNFHEQQDLATEIISKFPMLDHSLLEQLKVLQEENFALMRQYASIAQ